MRFCVEDREEFKTAVTVCSAAIVFALIKKIKIVYNNYK